MTPAEYIRASPLWPSEGLDGVRDDDGDVWASDGTECSLAGFTNDYEWSSFGLPDLDHAGTRAMLLEHLSKVTGWLVGVGQHVSFRDTVGWVWTAIPLAGSPGARAGLRRGGVKDTAAEALLDAWKWAETKVAKPKESPK